MADLVLNYGLLHTLAGDIRALKTQIETDVNAGGSGRVVGTGGPIERAAVGDPGLYGALSAFFTAASAPFKDSIKRLDDLAGMFDGVSNAFFEVDADFAVRASGGQLSGEISAWLTKKEAWDKYQDLKAKGLWSTDQTPPDPPGPMPTSAVTDGVTTTGRVGADGRVLSETTTVRTPSGQTYTETTDYTYTPTGKKDPDGQPEYLVGFDSTITHADGTRETVKQVPARDGSVRTTSTTSNGTTTSTTRPFGEPGSYRTITVDPKGHKTTTTVVVTGKDMQTGTKTVLGPDGIESYTGNPSTNDWTRVDPPEIQLPEVRLPPG